MQNPSAIKANIPVNQSRIETNTKSSAAPSPFLPMKPQHRAFIVGCFGLFLLIVMISSVGAGSSHVEWIPLALTLYVALLVIPFVGYKRSFGWLHPVVFTSIMSLFQLFREYSKYSGGIEWHIALPGYSPSALSGLVSYELMLQSIGTLAYYAGFFYLPTLRVPRLTFAQPRTMNLKIPAIVGFSFMVFIVYLFIQGGLSAHLLSWGQSRHVALAGEFYFSLFISFAAYGTILWMALEPGVVRQPIFWVCALASLIMIFLTTGSRSSVIYMVLLALMVDMLRRQKIPAAKLLILGLASVIVVSVLGEFRRGTYKQSNDGRVDTSAFSSSQSVGDLFSQGTSEVVNRGTTEDAALPILARVPEEIDLLYGESYLAVITLPIPRGMWTWGEKPALIGGRVGRTFFSTQAGVPPGAVGESYWNFHIPGVIMVFLLFGAFHRWLAKLFVTYRSQSAMILIYVVTLWYIRPVSSAVAGWLIVIVPVLVMMRGLNAIAPGRGRADARKLASWNASR